MMSDFAGRKDLKIWNCGQGGLVGSALDRRLQTEECTLIQNPSRTALDLRCQTDVLSFVAREQPDLIFLSAATVGGIGANVSHPAAMITNNLQIQTNILHAAWKYNVGKLVFLGSSCIYPKMAEQPICEEALLSGPLEPTNKSYAVAKIAGIEMCQAFQEQYDCNFVSVMPSNLYGEGDHFDLENAHVLPTLIRKFHDAKIKGVDVVDLWGTGTPLREFLHVDDLADALVFVAKKYDNAGLLNIGSGDEITIKDLSRLIARIVGYQGIIRFDADKPDGTPRKLVDSSRLNQLGWTPKISLKEGIASTYAWFKQQDPASFQEHRTKYDLW